ncbi:hypothetical protein AAL_08242 [Moelleriella libera RCEF 2490]|uniref:Only prolin and serin are matching in the corresponding protein n=1 Tax=Moelleriella libera RCEF 2490 TaxID=1081109 RepID=A0A167VRP0_9HYPO|nr:hypothetical protein AAL_08242 [Moelleriella libera RCEF 2490]
MSPRLKASLLPQLVQRRQVADAPLSYMAGPDLKDLSCVYYTTTNSSSSDLTSPVTPVFSPKGHRRFSSSTSSLDVPLLVPPECPSSPAQNQGTSSSVRQLADVEEEPVQSAAGRVATPSSDASGLYKCLCTPGPVVPAVPQSCARLTLTESHPTGDHLCTHSSSSEAICPDDVVTEFDFDYDVGFLSDGEITADASCPRKRANATESSTFLDFATKIARMPTIRRWRSAKRTPRKASPTTCPSSEKAWSSKTQSSRSSSASASQHYLPDSMTESSLYSLDDDDDADETGLGLDMTLEDRSHLERDRAQATTPLLPPLLTDVFASPPKESPLQSPKVESSPVPDVPLSPSLATPPQYGRPPLSTRPSMTSLRKVSSTGEQTPGLLPTIMQEHDEWADRLGHANFTIIPEPYELENFEPETITQFDKDWELSRVNYTRHLVRTGENYGQTSKIFALTQAKWAEIDRKWNMTIDEVIKHTCHTEQGSAPASRDQSRGRGRGRSCSSNAAATARLTAQDAETQWRRLEDCLPSAVPQILESLNRSGKFPGRLADGEFVGPMRRDTAMPRARSEDTKNRFWRNLVYKVALRK